MTSGTALSGDVATMRSWVTLFGDVTGSWQSRDTRLSLRTELGHWHTWHQAQKVFDFQEKAVYTLHCHGNWGMLLNVNKLKSKLLNSRNHIFIVPIENLLQRHISSKHLYWSLKHIWKQHGKMKRALQHKKKAIKIFAGLKTKKTDNGGAETISLRMSWLYPNGKGQCHRQTENGIYTYIYQTPDKIYTIAMHVFSYMHAHTTDLRTMNRVKWWNVWLFWNEISNTNRLIRTDYKTDDRSMIMMIMRILCKVSYDFMTIAKNDRNPH